MRQLPYCMLLLSAACMHAEAPEFVADFGGGGTSSREIRVEEEYLGGYDPVHESANRVEGLDNLRLRYKLYTLMGELVMDSNFYWELDADARLVYRFGYAEDNLYSFHYLEGDANREGVISAAALAEYGDLLEILFDLKPQTVDIRLWLDLEGGSSGFDQFNSTSPEWSERHLVTVGSPSAIVTPDLIEISGVWQEFSVPSSPDWESDRLSGGVRELFAARLPAEDIVARKADPERILWPEGVIKYIASEYLRREALQDQAARRRQIRDEDSRLNDQDFWNSADAALEETVSSTVPEHPVALLPRYVRSQPAASDWVSEIQNSSPIDLINVEVYPYRDGRLVTINRAGLLNGIVLERFDTSGELLDQSELQEDFSFEMLGGLGPLVFSRNGQQIATYTKLEDPEYVTVVIADELTDVEVDSREITLAVFDDGSVDGDRIDLYVNGRRILFDRYLTESRQRVRVALRRGPNIVQIVATSEGSSSPNTSALTISNVVDGLATQDWELETGETATLNILAPVR